MAPTQAAKTDTPVVDLRLGRSEQSIVCRLLRFWDSKNVKKQGEFMGITVLLLDAKESVIHGFITAARSEHYRPYLKAGSNVRVSRFEVAREVEVDVALLDNASSVFRRLLGSPEKTRRAMLFTSLNPKRIGGRLCLISTIGTRFYFGDEFPALIHITKRLGLGQMHNLSLLDVGAAVNASQLFSIGDDLNMFLTDTESRNHF